MKTLLLCGYRSTQPTESALGLQLNAAGETLIDQRVRELRALGHDPVCVLSGANADEQLRSTRKIQDCELVFDTNEPVGLLSNARSGVFAAVGEAAFILPVEIAPAPLEVWNFLLNEYGKAGFATPHAFLQAVDPAAQGAAYHFGFPLLLTREGGKLLQKTVDLGSLVDTRLKYLQVSYAPTRDLAPAPFPL